MPPSSVQRSPHFVVPSPTVRKPEAFTIARPEARNAPKPFTIPLPASRVPITVARFGTEAEFERILRGGRERDKGPMWLRAAVVSTAVLSLAITITVAGLLLKKSSEESPAPQKTKQLITPTTTPQQLEAIVRGPRQTHDSLVFEMRSLYSQYMQVAANCQAQLDSIPQDSLNLSGYRTQLLVTLSNSAKRALEIASDMKFSREREEAAELKFRADTTLGSINADYFVIAAFLAEENSLGQGLYMEMLKRALEAYGQQGNTERENQLRELLGLPKRP